MGSLLIRIDSIKLVSRVFDVLCVISLGGCPDQMTKRKYVLVSKTWIRDVSSAATPFEYPPSTKTRVPSEAMAWDDLPCGLGPTLWNLNHLRAAFRI